VKTPAVDFLYTVPLTNSLFARYGTFRCIDWNHRVILEQIQRA